MRVRTFSNDNSRYPGDVKSYTYVIIQDQMTVEAHTTNLPVVFLVTDPENLWDKQYGIMIKGNDYTGKGEADEMMIGQSDKKEVMGKYANFNMRGRMWEKPATFTYMNAGGTKVLYETDLNIRIFGAFSRKIAQKGIALIARKGVGDSPMEYSFFENRPFTSYRSLVLRASGQDAALSRIRDVLVQSLLDDVDVDLANQAFVQCVVYLNGQYWGVYNLREKISKHYIAQHYGIEDEDTIDILKGNGNNEQCIVAGNGLQDYKDLIAFCENHNCDLSNQSDYNYVCSQIDADQFAMYCAFEIIIGNTDTGNIKWWRSSEKDNKWRWIQYDYCWAMKGDNQSQAAEKSTGYRRDYFWRYFDPAGHGAGNGFSRCWDARCSRTTSSSRSSSSIAHTSTTRFTRRRRSSQNATSCRTTSGSKWRRTTSCAGDRITTSPPRAGTRTATRSGSMRRTIRTGTCITASNLSINTRTITSATTR